MKGRMACDTCHGVHFCASLDGQIMVLECAGCGARTGFRASGPVMADVS